MTQVSQAARRIPLRDFFRNSEKSGFRVSPDGAHISWLAPYERRMNLHVQARESGEIRRLTAETARDIGGYLWKGNDWLVYIRDFGGDENFHLFSVSRTGGEQKDLTPFENVQVQLVDELEENEHEVLIAMNKRDPQCFDVYRLNVSSGEMELLAENPGNITNWVTDHEGMLRIAVTTDG